MFKKSPTNHFKSMVTGVSSYDDGNVMGITTYHGHGKCHGHVHSHTYNNHQSLHSSTVGSLSSSSASGFSNYNINNQQLSGLCYYNYFSLPTVDIIYNKDGDYIPLRLKCTLNETTTLPYISSSIYSHLCDIKEQIEKYQESWDNIKKFTNPYEFIHTNISGSKTNISKLRPLSRSFYKMVEIVLSIKLLDEYSDTIKCEPDYNSGIRTFHLAEGPGGFIEAISYLRGLEYAKIKKQTSNVQESSIPKLSPNVQILKRNTELHDEFMKELEHNKISKRIFERKNGNGNGNGNLHNNDSLTLQQTQTMHGVAKVYTGTGAGPVAGITSQHEIYGNDRYYGMTLVNDDPICPGWKKTKTFLEANPNVIIETGQDKTGNLLSLNNFRHCASLYRNKMDIITADGGFDFSVDFNNQENIASRLILAEVFYALALQKKGGSFILKIFDIFHKPTVDIMYMLSYYYSNVSVMKPYTSRIANSEKYIICQGFKLDDSTALIEQISEFFPSFVEPLHELAVGDVHDKDNDNDNKHGHDDAQSTQKQIVSLLERNHDLFYLNKIEEMNAILTFQQIENISSTLSIITSHKNTEKIEQYKKQNILKCIAWCEKYNIPYFKQTSAIPGGNIFLHRA
jgi:23S rRNA U2552 (ribose-2'-O)-methylase RlmE/FtsJ